MRRASRGDFFESPLLLLAKGFVEFNMHLDAGKNSVFVFLRVKPDLNLPHVPSFPLRIHAQGDTDSRPQRPQE